MASRPDMVEAIWLDSGLHIDHGWASAEAYTTDVGKARLEVRTVGMLMHEDEDIVVIGLSYDPQHEAWYGAQAILKQNLLRLEWLG